MEVGQRVRLQGLASRTALNGAHATVVAPESVEEAAELAHKGRVKVLTALAHEVLSVRVANAQLLDETDDEPALFSTSYFAVVPSAARGYMWTARRTIPAGKLLLRESPLLVNCIADHLGDPVIEAARAELEPLTKSGECPAKAKELFERCAARIAERLYASLASRERRRYMALSDAFSEPPTKTVYNICAKSSTTGAPQSSPARRPSLPPCR